MKFGTLQDLGIDIDRIEDESIKGAIIQLFNIIEEISAYNRELQKENQRLRDEINILKGEQPKPDIRPRNQNTQTNVSSEEERKNSNRSHSRNREPKKPMIQIDRVEPCPVNPELLPHDAQFKGYERVVVQDILITTDNIEFHKEVYYSASLRTTLRGQLPPGYHGEFGPTTKALAIILKHVCTVSEPKIVELFKHFGIHIGNATLSGMLIKGQDVWHIEKQAIYLAGLQSASYQQIDDTGARVNGENRYTHVLCNPFYAAYFTKQHKDRLTILDILQSFQGRTFCFNAETFRLLAQLRVSIGMIDMLQKSLPRDKIFTQGEVEILLQTQASPIGKTSTIRILEAAAIAAYHQQRERPIVAVLLCDDAPQFKLLTEELALCWVHDGRHYKKLRAVVPHHQELVHGFLQQYWGYYQRLIAYQKNPSPEKAEALAAEFDRLFSTQTAYRELDERIAKTKAKKRELLLVLKYPELPLHNNAAESAIRAQVRKRDVSLQTRTEDGTKAVDTFLTIVQTAKKLGVNAYEYIFDRVSQTYALPSLADVIKEKTLMRMDSS